MPTLALLTLGRLVVLVGMMIFYGPLLIGSPFYVLFGAQLCGRRVSGVVSRQREFLADADAVLLTRDPDGLALALVKVGAARVAGERFRAAAALGSRPADLSTRRDEGAPGGPMETSGRRHA